MSFSKAGLRTAGLLFVSSFVACSTPPEIIVEALTEEQWIYAPEIEIAEVVEEEPLACTNDVYMRALRVAAIQQRLMVAGYVCQMSGPYNDFVESYRVELLASDFTLQNFFVNLHGENGSRTYDGFKTRLANLSMRESAANLDVYCVAVQREFGAAKRIPVKSLEILLANPEVKAANSNRVCDLLAMSL